MPLAALLPSHDPVLLALIVLFLLISGIIKGFLGIGLPAAGMALLTLIMPPTEAIALLWVPIIVSNAWQFARAPARRDIIMSYRWFAAAIIVSILLTSMFITSYPAGLLTAAIGLALPPRVTALAPGAVAISGTLGWLRRRRRPGCCGCLLLKKGRHATDIGRVC